MEQSADDVSQTKLKTNTVVENFENLSESQIEDVPALPNQIQKYYRRIIQLSTNPTSPFRMFFKDLKSTYDTYKYEKNGEGYEEDANFDETLLYITKCIAFAERDSAELAAAYSDRSNVLFKLKRYNCCIQDVDRAIKITDCPRGLKKKLRERKKECWIELEKIEAPVEDQPSEWRKLGNFRQSNAHPANLSSKIKEEFDEKGESYLVAIKDIEPGEMLSVEDFYATSLRLTESYTRCSFCLLLCDTLIPCSTCTQEMYCSENCQSQAFNLFHQAECKFIKLYDSKMLDCKTILAIRMFLIGTDQGKQLKNTTKKKRCRDHQSRFLDYCSVLEIPKIDRVRRNHHVCVAVCIVIVLLRSSFFGNIDTLPDRLDSVQSYAALLLTYHLITVEMRDPRVEVLHNVLNDDNITEIDGQIILKESDFAQTIGYGICLLQNSLISRSCFANTSTFIQNRQQIVFATRKIRSGEELFTSSPRHKFHSLLKQKRGSLNNFCVAGSDVGSTNCPLLESLEEAETLFWSALDSCFSVTVEEGVPGIMEVETMLGLFTLYCDSLGEIMPVTSPDIILCEQFLIVLLKGLYCDHHRHFKDQSLLIHFMILASLIEHRNPAFSKMLPRIKNKENLNFTSVL